MPLPLEPEVRVTIQPPVRLPPTDDERLLRELDINSEGFNYLTYPVKILEKRCRRWARVNKLPSGSGLIAFGFCKRASKKVLKHVAEGGHAEEGLPENITPRERRLFDINPGLHSSLCQLTLNHIQHSRAVEDLRKEFLLDDAPMNENIPR